MKYHFSLIARFSTFAVLLSFPAAFPAPACATAAAGGLDTPTGINNLPFSVQGQELMNLGSGLAVGADYAGTNAPPSNGAIIEGNVSIGTAMPLNQLDVNGSAAIGTYAGSVAAPTNDLIVGGAVGVGSSKPMGNVDIENGHNTATLCLNSQCVTSLTSHVNMYIGLYHTSNGAFWECTASNPLTGGCSCATGTRVVFSGETGEFWNNNPWDSYFVLAICG